MEPAGLTVSQVAERLGVDRKTVSRIVNGRAGISAEMAILLSRAFNTTPELWLTMQRNYDLWHASRCMEQRASKVMPFEHRLHL
jgi:addiction module HigA family antidote